jgi:electron transfer flavoprotein alpha subunit
MSNVLVFVEQAAGKPRKSSLAGVSCGQHLAAKGGGALHLVVIGSDAQKAASALGGYGAKCVYAIEGASFSDFLVESYTAALAAAVQACGATYVAGATSSVTKDVMARLAARLGAAMASDVMEVVSTDTFKRPMWAGNAIATVQLKTPVKICTVRATEFAAPESKPAASPVEKLEVAVDLASFKTRFMSKKEIKSERPDVTTADVVVSGGRGVKGPDGFKLVEQLADLLKAGVGASRAVCDAGWAPNDLQIGQTGKVVAPNLYIAVGISGAIQHAAGMKGSKTIVAINKDAEAPIFQLADYGLVGDLFQAVPELMAAIKQLRQ